MDLLVQLEGLVRLIAQFVARLAELSAALIVAFAVLEALYFVLRVFWKRDAVPDHRKEDLRLALGRWLAIALEFLLAADIVLTAIAPTWQDIGQLGAVALIRTALNFFLQREFRAQAERRRAHANGEAEAS
ncbi:DUF1622 domain-containing protein [Deinococcus ficus]|uniref:DUF1622 domain-containing protein n=1 Tax=Deinococcus ficus TaxID=317577 RepID=A0A221SY63_9DEIO|nr:DUF1622 domain-containing protein [Deinococcus ficus]ASN81589.1 hypothetical protein DFI_11805 [Deinococcus ficus]